MDAPLHGDDGFGWATPPRFDDLLAEAPAGHEGAERLRAAHELLQAGEPALAAGAAADSRSCGLPAELMPHALLLEAAALVEDDQPEAAAMLLVDGWRSYPDIAAMPALLGAAQAIAGDGAAAARSLLAAVAAEDPDGSLAMHRRLLTSALRVLHRKSTGSS